MTEGVEGAFEDARRYFQVANEDAFRAMERSLQVTRQRYIESSHPEQDALNAYQEAFLLRMREVQERAERRQVERRAQYVTMPIHAYRDNYPSIGIEASYTDPEMYRREEAPTVGAQLPSQRGGHGRRIIEELWDIQACVNGHCDRCNGEDDWSDEYVKVSASEITAFDKIGFPAFSKTEAEGVREKYKDQLDAWEEDDDF